MGLLCKVCPVKSNSLSLLAGTGRRFLRLLPPGLGRLKSRPLVLSACESEAESHSNMDTTITLCPLENRAGDFPQVPPALRRHASSNAIPLPICYPHDFSSFLQSFSLVTLPPPFTLWSSQASPRRGHVESPLPGRKQQVSFPIAPGVCYHSRSSNSYLRSSGHLSSQCITNASNPAFHHQRHARREYSSVATASTKQAPRTKNRASKNTLGDRADGTPTPPKRSELYPPKQAPSVWQIFFTDWLEHKKSQESDDRRLNVAHIAKEAGQVYNKLSDEERHELKQRAVVLKEKYERELAAWKRTLTPGDIAQENEFRSAQRRSGKSRRKNIPDPNAPKRPLGAYFMFLQVIRGNPQMVADIFCGETDTTRQSVLAAGKWRAMSDEAKRPYFEQADNAKLKYETERKAYEQTQSSYEYSTVTSVVLYHGSSSVLPRRHENDDGGA